MHPHLNLGSDRQVSSPTCICGLKYLRRENRVGGKDREGAGDRERIEGYKDKGRKRERERERERE